MLRSALRNAGAVLSRVAERCACNGGCPVGRAVVTLRTYATDLKPFRGPSLYEDNPAKMTPSWPLDPAWHPIVFALGKDQPKVLLTIALNSVRSLSGVYEDVLGIDWSCDDFVQVATCQNDGIDGIRGELEQLRRDLNHWPDATDRGLLHIAPSD